MESDWLLQAAAGALEGFKNAYVPFKNLEVQDIYKQADEKRRQKAAQDAMLAQQNAEFGTFSKELPLSEASKIRIENAKDDQYVVNPPPGVLPKGLKPFNLAVPAIDKVTAANKAKLDREKPKAFGSLQKTLQNYDSLISQSEGILNDESLGSATGLFGSKNKLTEGARRVGANLETVKAKTLLNVLGGLKELSTTGASGFGQLSNTEGETIKNSVANLDRSLGTPDFKNNLRSFIKDARQSRQLIKSTYENTYGEKVPDNNSGGLPDPGINLKENKDPLGLGY